MAKIAQEPLVAFPVTLAPAIRHAAKYSSVLIGHTRQATTGAVTDKNAHPFYDPESRIAWAHNGMIYNHSAFGTFDVDSQALLTGIKERNFSKYRGPIALLWIEQGKIHAFRKGNPLYRGARNRAVYLASEESMLAAIGCKRIKELSEGRLYIFEGTEVSSSKTIACNEPYGTYSHRPCYQGEDFEGWHDGRTRYWNYKTNDWDYREPWKYSKTEKKWEPRHRCHTSCQRIQRQVSTAGELMGHKTMDLRGPGEPDILSKTDKEPVPGMCVECGLQRQAEGAEYCMECYMAGAQYRNLGGE